MADEEQKEGEEGAEEKPKSKMMLIIIIAVVVVLLGGGGAAFMLMSGGGEGEEGEGGEAVHEETQVALETVELDPFIVNLSEQTSFLKVKMLVEYDPELLSMGHSHGGGHAYGGGGAGGGGDPEPGLPGVMGEREPMMRDAIIRVISSKTPKEVLSAEGKELLKEELVEAINESLGLDEPAVVNVYFLEFIIQ